MDRTLRRTKIYAGKNLSKRTGRSRTGASHAANTLLWTAPPPIILATGGGFMALDPITLGRRLREARENCRLTQEQAAQAIGISRTALLHIEAGKRSLSTLELSQLARLYRRSVADFFAEDEGQPSREDDPLVMIHRLPRELVDDPEMNRQSALTSRRRLASRAP
jgi:transcriptional regulator with XRE-family HTH domain